MERQQLLEPWPGPWERWASKFCFKNSWRVYNTIGDRDDCIAECALVYVECLLRYGRVVKTPSQFMRLYQISVYCWFNTMSNKDSGIRKSLVYTTDEIEEMIDNLVTPPEVDLAVKLGKAPSEIQEIVGIFLNAPQEVMDVMRRDATSCSPRQFWKQVLKLLGINQDRSQELADKLREILS